MLHHATAFHPRDGTHRDTHGTSSLALAFFFANLLDSRGSFGTFPSMMALRFLQYVMTGPFEGPRLRTRRFVFQSSVTTLVHAMDTETCKYRHRPSVES